VVRANWRVPALLGDIETARAAATGMADAPDPELRYQGAMAMAVLAQLDGDLDAALGWLDRAMRSAPTGNVGAWQPASEAIRLLLAVPDPTRAEDRIRAAERDALPPQRVFLSGARAIAAAQAGDSAESARARADFEQLLRRSPQPPPARQRLQADLEAAIAMAHDRPAEALGYLEGTHQPSRGLQPPGFLDLRFLEARALWLSGRGQEAQPLLLAVLEDASARLQSPLPWVRSLYLLGAIAREEGDDDAASDYFTRFVESWNNGSLDRDLVRDARVWLNRQD
jgi:tetratricopeptide (TPR) repeat protein